MNYAAWYTDRMDIYRVEDETTGNLTRSKRVLVRAGVPCRVYQSGKSSIYMKDTAATVQAADKLACGMDADLRKGDELQIYRGGGLGISRLPERYFAGGIQDYPEPFGAVLPGLAHKEVALMQEVRT